MKFGNLFREGKARWRTARAMAEIDARRLSPRPHGLDAPLTVSLTSYPARYGTLGLTLKGLLRQTVKPDRVILWLTRGDEALLPPEVEALRSEGLEIGLCGALRSYTKLIPALLDTPDHAIVTADDDVYYWPEWLEELVEARRRTGHAVLCHRAHRVRLGPDGLPLPYGSWDRRLNSPPQSGLLFPTGVLGVFYDAGVFHLDVCREDLFLSLCPSADDVWLYWMHRLQGHRAVQIGPHRRVLEWRDSQSTNLRTTNTGDGGNDRAVAALVTQYGFPLPF